MTEPYKNLGHALRAHPDLFERFHGERRDAATRYLRTLDPADKERADGLRAEILAELSNRGASWYERGVVLGYGATDVRGPGSVSDGDIAHRLGQRRAREAEALRRGGVANG